MRNVHHGIFPHAHRPPAPCTAMTITNPRAALPRHPSLSPRHRVRQQPHAACYSTKPCRRPVPYNARDRRAANGGPRTGADDARGRRGPHGGAHAKRRHGRSLHAEVAAGGEHIAEVPKTPTLLTGGWWRRGGRGCISRYYPSSRPSCGRVQRQQASRAPQPSPTPPPRCARATCTSLPTRGRPPAAMSVGARGGTRFLHGAPLGPKP